MQEWLRELPAADRKIIGDDIRYCELGCPVGLPLCRPIVGAKGLWEIRSDLTGGRIARVVFMVSRGHMVLLHGFIKKSQKMPAKELDLALKRRNEVSAHD